MSVAKLPDGSQREYEDGRLAGELISELCPGAEAVAAKVQGQLVDFRVEVHGDVSLEPVAPGSEEGLETLRHTTSHVMAQAVQRLFPGAKLGIGPSIADGFYYDFDLEETLTSEDLEKIEQEMRRIIKEALPIDRLELPRDEAIQRMRDRGQPYKVELVKDLADERVSLFQQGEFVDLCAGPHLGDIGQVRAFRLLSVAGAYWRGSEQNPMLQRIYGTAFTDQKLLDEHLKRIEEAKQRDHRKLGKELGLYGIYEESGPGLVFFLPKGATLRLLIEDLLRREHRKRGYEIVISPHLLRTELWKISGHYQMNYPMYFTHIEDEEYGVKPMNCPGHILIYRSDIRSYRELPIRYFELGTVYRHEKSGVLHGLLRVRGFTQDDAHIFCTPDQLKDEIISVLDFARYLMDLFGLEYVITVGTRPEKSIGEPEDWERATRALLEALEDQGLSYTIAEKDGAFYGPKIDIAVLDALKKSWDGPTIQVDFALPERFDLKYVGPDGKEHRPVMVHRTVLGSMERFVGCLIEHYGGAFPTWLSPVQVRVLPIADAHVDYAEEVLARLLTADLRAEVDKRNEKPGYKIRQATLQKIPYMLIVGDREVANGTVAVRQRVEGDLGPRGLDEFLAMIGEEVAHEQQQC